MHTFIKNFVEAFKNEKLFRFSIIILGLSIIFYKYTLMLIIPAMIASVVFSPISLRTQKIVVWVFGGLFLLIFLAVIAFLIEWFV